MEDAYGSAVDNLARYRRHAAAWGSLHKNGDRVMEVMRTKHPNARPQSAASLDTCTSRPLELVFVEITDYTVMEGVGRLSVGAGQGGTDLVSLKNWLLILVAASRELQLTVADFAGWLANG